MCARAAMVLLLVLAFASAAVQARTCFTSISTLVGTDREPCDGGSCAVDWQLGVDDATREINLFWVVIGPHRRPLNNLHASEPVVSATCTDAGATVTLAITARYSDGVTSLTWVYDGAGVSCADMYDASAPDASLQSFRMDVSIVGSGTWTSGDLGGAGYALGALDVNCNDLPVQDLDNTVSPSASGAPSVSSAPSESAVPSVSAVPSASTAPGSSSDGDSLTIGSSSGGDVLATGSSSDGGSLATGSSSGSGSLATGSSSGSGSLATGSSSGSGSVATGSSSGSGSVATGSASGNGSSSGSGSLATGSASGNGSSITTGDSACVLGCQRDADWWKNVYGPLWKYVPIEESFCGVSYHDIALRGNRATQRLPADFARAGSLFVQLKMLLLAGDMCDASDLSRSLYPTYSKLESFFANESACTPSAGAELALQEWSDDAKAWADEQMCVDQQHNEYSAPAYKRALVPSVECQIRFKGNDTKRCINIFGEPDFCRDIFSEYSSDGVCMTVFSVHNPNNYAVDIDEEKDQEVVWDKEELAPEHALFSGEFLPGNNTGSMFVMWRCERRVVRQLLWCVVTNTIGSGRVRNCARAEFRVDNCGSNFLSIFGADTTNTRFDNNTFAAKVAAILPEPEIPQPESAGSANSTSIHDGTVSANNTTPLGTNTSTHDSDDQETDVDRMLPAEDV